MSYYFIGEYDRNEAEKVLLGNGYNKKDISAAVGINSHQYVSDDEAFEINLTSPSVGMIEIQGDGPEDIYLNREKSKHYSTLSVLSGILSAKRIVDGNFDDVFPDPIPIVFYGKSVQDKYLESVNPLWEENHDQSSYQEDQ